MSPLPPLPDRETLRLHQANERTLLAWVRTALAMMGFGFVVARFGLFLREIVASDGAAVVARGGHWSLYTGLSLSALGVLTVLASLIRFHAITRAIERHEVGAPAGAGWIYAIGAAVIVTGVAICVLLLATH